MPEDTNTIAIATPRGTGLPSPRVPSRREGESRHRGELDRLVGIDFARFLAIIGMFCAHLTLPAGVPGHSPWLSAVVDGRRAVREFSKEVQQRERELS